jgi:hypothetical protein
LELTAKTAEKGALKSVIRLHPQEVVMSDGALRGTSEDPDAAISNQPEVPVPIELAVQPPSEGTDSVVSGVADGTELVAGQVRTEARLSEHWTAPATTQLVTWERRRSALHRLWPAPCTVRTTESRIVKAKCTRVMALGVGSAL